MPASAIGIILDPSEVATSRTELNINSGAIRIASEGPNWGDAAIAAAIADRKFGSVPVGYRIPNRIVTIPLVVRAVSGTTFNQAQTKLQQKVARFQDEGGWLKRTSSDGTTKLYADIVDATLTFPDPRFQDVEGGVVLTLECLPDFYGDETQGERFRTAIEAVDTANASLSTLLLADPDGTTGTLLDRSSNAYTGSLLNGATVSEDGLGGEDAIVLDGSNDYGSFAAPTRRNLCTNPSFEVDTTGWTQQDSGATSFTFTRSTSEAKYGSASAKFVNTEAGGNDYVYMDVPVTGGATYTVSAYVKTETFTSPATSNYGIGLWDGTSSSSVALAGATSGWERKSVTKTVAVSATTLGVYLYAPQGTIYWDGILIEKDATAGTFFDGSGYVNASGTWVASAGLECGWLGTAHASASDKGPLGNGKTTTFVGLARVSADAANGVIQTLWGSDVSAGGTGTAVFLYNAAGTRQLYLQVNATSCIWTLTAAEIAATAAGQTFAYRLAFNETADTATLQINGLPAVAKSSVTAQHAAGQTTVQLGAYASGSSPLPGKLGVSAILAGTALTAAEWTRIANSAGYSSDDNDSLIFTEPDIPGDYPARSRYTFTDTGSQARQAVLIASQSKTYDAATTAALTYEAEALTALDAAAIGTKSGAHGGASNNTVSHASIGPSWTGVLSTEHATHGHLTHHGSYRVFARVWSATYESRLRLEYAVGDSATRRVNASVTVPGDSEFYVVDLGEVRLDKPATGSHQWLGAIFAQSDTAGAAVGVDKLWFAPTESLTICKARQASTVTSSSLPLSTDARDSFSQTAGNLNGKTADRGGTWSTAGSTTDYTMDTTNGRAQRTTTSDAGPRMGVLGSAITATYASVEIVSSVFTQDLWQGLCLRYVDTSNYISVIHYWNLGYSNLDILQTVAGVTTILSETRIQNIAAGGLNELRAAVDTAGRVEASFVGTTVSAVCTAAKTGGALASGKAGIIDYHPSATATTRQWDNFIATAITVDTACQSGNILSARHDGAWRETEDAGIYTPVHVEGVLPRAPASGLEARTCRTLILPSAGDFDTLPDSDPLAFSVESAHRPAYLFAPEE